MDSSLAYCSICCILILATDGVTLTFKVKSVMPLKGSSLEFSCLLDPFNNDGIEILKGLSSVTTCYGVGYKCNFYKAGYSFTANITGVFGVISSLNTEAEGTWKCRHTAGNEYSNSWDVIVYTIPSGLSITQNPDQDVDLSVNSVELQCTTLGCTYPLPSVKWIFKDQATSLEYVYSISNATGALVACTGPEMIYTSTLNLPQYTKFTDNCDKTGNFICSMEYPGTSWNIISSSPHTVRFAVHVRNITLDPTGDKIISLDGTNANLRCTAGPSRPAAVIRWWLEGNEVTNLSNTTVTGADNLFMVSSELHLIIDRTHQGKKVYCDARVTSQVDAIESAKLAIQVWYQPSIPSVQTVQGNNFPWLENQTGTLQCVVADLGNPTASVKWTSSRGTMDMDGNLVFRNLSAIDHGQPVYCQVQNNFTDIKGLTVASPTILLNVEYRPSVTLIPSVQPLRINEGSNLTVTCMASGNPLPMVQWKNSNPPSNTLFIPNILRNNTGSYTCVASSTSTNYNRVVLQREESTIVIVDYSMYAPSVSDSAQVGLSVGGGVGIGVGCFVLGCIVTFIAFTIRRQINVSKSSCFRRKGRTDDVTYSNTEMTSQPIKPIYEELNKGPVEHNMYDKIEHSADGT